MGGWKEEEEVCERVVECERVLDVEGAGLT